ncbi:hypothetical protein ACO0RG_001942 [Hanseniaspora osmophila]
MNKEFSMNTNSLVQLNKYFSYDTTKTGTKDETNMINTGVNRVNYSTNESAAIGKINLNSTNSCTALLQLINEQSVYNTPTTLSNCVDNDGYLNEIGNNKFNDLIDESSDNTPSNTVFNTNDRYEHFTYGFDHFDIEENGGRNDMRKFSYYDSDSNGETANVSEDECEINTLDHSLRNEYSTPTSQVTNANTSQVTNANTSQVTNANTSQVANANTSQVTNSNTSQLNDGNGVDRAGEEDDDDGIVICPSKLMNYVDPTVLYSKLVLQKFYSKKLSETPVSEASTREANANGVDANTRASSHTAISACNHISHTPCLPPKDKEILDEILECIATPSAPTENPFTLCSSSVSSTPQRTSKKYSESERTFRCDKCPRAFFRSEHLRRHLNSVHLQLKKYQCMKCYEMGVTNKYFARSDNYKAHLKTHVCVSPATTTGTTTGEASGCCSTEQASTPFSPTSANMQVTKIHTPVASTQSPKKRGKKT